MRPTGQFCPPRRAGKRARARKRRGADVFLMLAMIGLSLLAISAGAHALMARNAEGVIAAEDSLEKKSTAPIEGFADANALSVDTASPEAVDDLPSIQDNPGPALSEPYDFSSPVPLSDPVDAAYFDDAVFIGDSRTEGLFLNTGLSNATPLAHMGLMVDTVFTKPLFNVDGEKVWVYSSVFVQKYGEIIDAIREINPEAIIYIQAIMPVSQTVSDSHSYIKNSKISAYNRLLQGLAEEKQVYYLDTAGAVAGEGRSLPEDAAPDGIHLARSYCEKWLDYLIDHTAPQ